MEGIPPSMLDEAGRRERVQRLVETAVFSMPDCRRVLDRYAAGVAGGDGDQVGSPATALY